MNWRFTVRGSGFFPAIRLTLRCSPSTYSFAMSSSSLSNSVTRYVASAPQPNLGFITYFLPFSDSFAISGDFIRAFFRISVQSSLSAHEAADRGEHPRFMVFSSRALFSSGSMESGAIISPASQSFAFLSIACLKFSAVDSKCLPAQIFVPAEG